MNRICRKCNIEKPIESFSAHRAEPSGRRKICRTCVGAYNKEIKARMKEAGLYRKKKALENRVWRAKYQHKRAAHRVVEWAIETGKIQRQPCQVCGTTSHVHAHHDDYSKPLDVMWLCPLHHVARHKELVALQPPGQSEGSV